MDLHHQGGGLQLKLWAWIPLRCSGPGRAGHTPPHLQPSPTPSCVLGEAETVGLSGSGRGETEEGWKAMDSYRKGRDRNGRDRGKRIRNKEPREEMDRRKRQRQKWEGEGLRFSSQKHSDILQEVN